MKNLSKRLLTILFILFLFSTCSKDEEPTQTPPPIVKFSLTTQVSPTGSGTVSPSSGSFEQGNDVSLKANPSEKYKFKEWTGAITSNNNPITLSMNSNKSATAIFEEVTYVPDNHFEQALIDLGYDDLLDDYVLTKNIKDILKIELSKKEIKDLTGIEDFTALKHLDVWENQLTSIDVSKNLNLTWFSFSANQISSIDISNNIKLDTLTGRTNQLSELNISKNTNLKLLSVLQNKLTSLDVSKNNALTWLKCSDNQLTNLDVSSNSALITLSSTNNQLTCIQVNQGQFNNIPTAWYKDGSAVYALDCSGPNAGKTYVPDDNFEQVLIDLEYDDVLDDYVITTNINNITKLEIIEKNISDLTGIEDFVDIQHLNLGRNKLTSINVSKNLNLITLAVYENQLSSIDLTNNSNLDTLALNYNPLYSLDISKNPNLKLLGAAGIKLTSLDITKNTKLETLVVAQNELTTLDVSNNSNLTEIYIFSNSLTSFDVSNNPKLELLQIQNNYTLTSLIVSNNSKLKEINLDWNNVSSLDLSSCINLEVLKAYDNELTYANLSNCANLTSLILAKNKLSSIDISDSPNILILDLSSNQISEIDISNNPSLEHLRLLNNELTNIDVSNNTNLKELNLYYNQLSLIDVSNNLNLVELVVQANILTALDISNNTNLESLSAFDNYLLFCIQVNQDQLNNIPSGWEKGYDAIYSLDCSDPNIGKTYVPDDNFEQALIDFGYDDILDDYVITTNINSRTNLSIYDNKNITDLTGIEDFINLEILVIWDNPLTSIDISNNTALTTLQCISSNITTLDVSNNIALTLLACSNNQLSALDVSNNKALTDLRCYGNQLVTLDVSNNTALTHLSCSSNQLDCIQVNQTQLNNVPSDWQKDSGATYSLDCSNSTDIVTDIDGNEYSTISIGSQVWMKENLKTTKYSNGDPIPNVTDNTNWTNLSSGAFSNYGNNEYFVDVIGRLYNWFTANDSRKICPEGWHVPTQNEFETMYYYLGGTSANITTGGKMKESGTTHWLSPNLGATNESGFTALPGGFRYPLDGLFKNYGSRGYWWSSTSQSSEHALYLGLFYETSSVNLGVSSIKETGMCIRCIQD